MTEHVILIFVLIAIGIIMGLFGKKIEAFQTQMRNDSKGTTVNVKFKIVRCENTVRQEEGLKYAPATIVSTNGKASVALLPQKKEITVTQFFFTLEDENGKNFRFSVSKEMFEKYHEGDEITFQMTARENFLGVKEVIYRYQNKIINIYLAE